MSETAINPARDQLASITMALFALPTLGAGYMFCLVNLYIMKFATDILLIAPAVMGLIFGISRVWDAISDPLVGYWSDKTRSRFGRRRPWVLASAVPIALSFWMLSAPPTSIDANLLVLWMGVGIILFFSAQTMFVVPHIALGAEMSEDYHERNKIFGFRHAGWIGGYILALGTMHVLIQAEQDSVAAVRMVAANQSLLAGLFIVACLLICVSATREKSESVGRGAQKPWRAARDIWRNKHARVIIVVNFIENLGGATITILTLYNAEYVMRNPTMAPVFILSYMVFSFVLVPCWMPFARRVGKKNAWIASLIVTAFAFGCMGLLQVGDTMELIVLAAIAGAAGGCGGTISPSIKSDVIDYDEYLTGERKEGAYFAAWNFVAKSAYGVMLTVTGFALSWAGFVPRVEQSELVINTLRFLYGGVPFIVYLIGAALMLGFSFNEKEHTEIREKLAAGERHPALAE